MCLIAWRQGGGQGATRSSGAQRGRRGAVNSNPQLHTNGLLIDDVNGSNQGL